MFHVQNPKLYKVLNVLYLLNNITIFRKAMLAPLMTLAQALAVPLPVQLPANIPVKAIDLLSPYALVSM